MPWLYTPTQGGNGFYQWTGKGPGKGAGKGKGKAGKGATSQPAQKRCPKCNKPHFPEACWATFPHLKEEAAKKRKKLQSLEEQEIQELEVQDLGALEVGCTECATDIDLAGSPLRVLEPVCCPPGLRDDCNHDSTIPGDIIQQVALGARAYPRSGTKTD